MVSRPAASGLNRRIEKRRTTHSSHPNHIDYFYNQGWQLLEERIASTADVPEEVKQYVWSLSYIDAPIVQFHDTDAGGTYDAERYYTFDANQNITEVFDGANGNVLERYVYDPYGAVTVYDSAWANPTAPSQPKTARCMSVTTSTPRPASTTCAIATTTPRSVGSSRAIRLGMAMG